MAASSRTPKSSTASKAPPPAAANPAPLADDPAAELRGKLAKRLAVAAVLVALLLGTLAVFDYLAKTPDEVEAPVFTQPVPVGPKKEMTQAVRPMPPESPDAVASAGDAGTPATTVAVPEALPPPRVDAIPATAKPPSALPAKAENRPLTTSTAASAPAPAKALPAARAVVDDAPVARPSARAAVSTPSSAPARAAPVIAEGSAEPIAAPAEEFAGKTPVRAASTASASPPATPPPEKLGPKPSAKVVTTRPGSIFSGFVLQAGVFSSSQRAEELHARLTLSGVPSTLETRVQVGPFKTRAEALSAQAKLREIGVEAVLIPPRSER